MQTLWNLVYATLGLASEPKDLTLLQISCRGVIVFFASLFMVRLGDRRSLAQKSAFDLVLIVIIASVLARAINGSAPFLPTLGGALIIILLHRGLAYIVCLWPAVGGLLKGRPVVLVRNGRPDPKAMHAQLITADDLEEDMRLSLKTEDKGEIGVARLEPSGDISFIKGKKAS
ncbi:MAG TPA: YetF domain-containing protein [Chthoniobacterales bacterium]|jgi:uncharacterized membrane protein YcaP (DUF421 family)